MDLKNITVKSDLDFEQLRNRMLNDMLLATGIAAIPALTISIWRVTFLGFQSFMAVQIILVSILWLLWIKRSKFSYILRASGLLGILAFATFAALSQLGPATDSKTFMILYAFSCVLFFNTRSAWLLIGTIILCMTIFGYAATQHWLTFTLDYETYAHHPLTWTISTWNMGIFSSIVAYIGWRMIHGIRKQSEQAQELATRIQRISERVPGVVYQYKLNPDGSDCFPYASDAIQNIYRVTSEQVRDDATEVFSILHPDDRELVSNSIQESAEKLSAWQLEYRVLFPDGTVRWLFGNALPQREPDGGTLWHGFITDITERKNMETIKDEFISTVSHELRTPLTSIKGSIKLINSGVLDSKKDKVKEMLNIAELNSERLLFLINDLLDIEKLQKGSVSLSYSTIEICDFLSHCISENQSFAQQYGTEITLHDCKPCNISIDAQRMKQVMANLLSNSCKFSPKDKPVEVFVDKNDKHLVIEVRDYGPGIPEEFKEKIFEKFTQADSSNTRKLTGTGLGLSIAQSIVRLHHGEIWFETHENIGTSFFVKLALR